MNPPEYIREHVEAIGVDAVDELHERFAICVEVLPDERAWVFAYQRVCRRHGVKPRPRQEQLFAV